MSPIRAWIEPFCGSASVGLQLVAGFAPPVCYQGSKTLLATTILAVLGLRPRQGCRHLVLLDLNPWSWAFAGLVNRRTSLLAADQLRHFGRAYAIGATPGPTELWRQLDKRSTPEALRTGQGWWVQLGSPPGEPRLVRRPTWHGVTDPPTGEELAVFLCLQEGNAFAKPVRVQNGKWRTAGYAHLSDVARAKGWRERLRPDLVAEELDALACVRWPTTTCGLYDGRAMEFDDLTGAVAYLDPPYADTTGYGAGVSRQDVLDLALRLDAAGCTVAVSEAEPIDLPGWHRVDLTGEVRLHAWTTRKKKTEWLTLNREPAWRPGRQTSLALVRGES